MNSSTSGSSRCFAKTKPVCVVAGFLLCRSVEALIPSIPMKCIGSHQRRSCVRPRGTDGLRCSAGDGETESPDSSEIYAAVRRRLQDLEAARSRGYGGESLGPGRERSIRSVDGDFMRPEGRARLSGSSDLSTGDEVSDGPLMADTISQDSEFWAYSGAEMKKTYYQAFWRARNLGRKTTKMGTDGEGLPAPPQEEGTRSTNLSPLAMAMVVSRFDASEEDLETEEDTVMASDIEGLTQAYCLVEKESTSPAKAAAYSDVVPAIPFSQAEFVEVGEWRDALAPGDVAEPQGLSQLFYLDPGTEEAVAQSIAEPYPSFLREKLGVPGAVVQDLRQVELDHARLAMLAVLLSGAVSAGVPTTADFMDASASLLTGLAHVARTPWLDPCVAGGILALKALSEGDWRLGKGALASWADQGLRVATDMGAKALRLGSGDKLRKLAVEMEVRHGRAALGAVVCAMAQQGFVTIGA